MRLSGLKILGTQLIMCEILMNEDMHARIKCTNHVNHAASCTLLVLKARQRLQTALGTGIPFSCIRLGHGHHHELH